MNACTMARVRRIVCTAFAVACLSMASACSPATILAVLGGCKQAASDTTTPANTTTPAASQGSLGSLKDVTGGDVWENMTITETMRWNNGNDGACAPYPDGQCTWWACMRGRRLGMDIGGHWGNGGDWAASAKAAGYTISDDKPVAGAIVSFPPGVQQAHPTYGHVAVVEKVDEKAGMLLISEMNVKGYIATSRVLPIRSGAHYILPGKKTSTKTGTGGTDGSNGTKSGSTTTVAAAWECPTGTDDGSHTTSTIEYKGDGRHATPDQAKAIAKTLMKKRYPEWGDGEFDALVWVWEHESGWRWDATNPSSGAYGIPQSLPASKLSSAGDDWKDNAGTQIAWGLDYIKGRYGSPSKAKSFWQSHNWY